MSIPGFPIGFCKSNTHNLLATNALYLMSICRKSHQNRILNDQFWLSLAKLITSIVWYIRFLFINFVFKWGFLQRYSKIRSSIYTWPHSFREIASFFNGPTHLIRIFVNHVKLRNIARIQVIWYTAQSNCTRLTC